MVVVVIIGILSALAVPKFIAITGENQLDGDANALFQDLQWARTAAIKTGHVFQVDFSTVTVNGTDRLKWQIWEIDAAASGGKTSRKEYTTGVSVVKGLPTGLSTPSISQTSGFAALNQGFQPGPTTEAAGTCRTTASTAPTWSDGLTICGGIIGDAETGAVYLYSTRSKSRAHGFVFNRTKSLTFKQLRYMGGSWEVM